MAKNFSELSFNELLFNDDFISHQIKSTEESTLYWNKWLVDNPGKADDWKRAISTFDAIQSGLQKYIHQNITEDSADHLLQRIKKTNSKRN